MPPANQYLLLYVLDLLSVFARKSDKNLMTAQSMFHRILGTLHLTGHLLDLAVIFRPGILSHPSHEMSPHEHALSQRVLEFLIAHQDWFMLDTPAPNPSLVSPPLPGNAGVPPSAYDHSRYPSRAASPSSRHPESGTGHINWGQGASEDDRGWSSVGVPMSDRDIEKEHERIKMIRRRTTLERGGWYSSVRCG